MLRLTIMIITALAFVTMTVPAFARHRTVIDANGNRSAIILVQSELGKIQVAAGDFENKIIGFIHDVKERGFRGPVHCYSWASSHVRNSLHHSGRACDFAQRGWGKTRAPMYHVADLARKWGLRDGCSFGDCGHIDAGGVTRTYHARSHHRYHYAARRGIQYAYAAPVDRLTPR